MFLILLAYLKVGLILPLCGDFGIFGRQFLKGFAIATDPLEIENVVMDSKADPFISLACAKSLNHRNVFLIIGDILSKPSLSIAIYANENKIPVIIPTSLEPRLSEVGEYIFRMPSLVETQAQKLARFLLDSLGIMDIAILAPKNLKGETAVKAFLNEFEDEGEILKIEWYEPECTNFKDHLLNIKDVEPEAIFIPAEEKEIELIAPELWFYDVISENTIICGLKEWGDEKLFNENKRYLEGVIFTQPVIDKKFSLYYKIYYGEEPGSFSYLGYIVGKLVQKMNDRNINTREKIKNFLKKNSREGIIASCNIKIKFYRVKNGRREEI